MSRRLLLAGVVTAVAAAALVTLPSSGRTGAARELADELDEQMPLSRFVFEHRAGGTRVLDCFLPNRAVTGAVDLDRGIAVFSAPGGQELARRDPERALVHRGALADGAVPAEWLAVELPASDDQRAALVSALGADLAGYLLAAGLPADGTATARAALDAATQVKRLDPTEVAQRGATGYRLTLDAEEFATAAGPASTATTPADAPAVTPPLVDVWIGDDGNVTRVSVQPIRPEGAVSEPEGGWTLDYRTGRRVNADEVADVTPLGQVDLQALRSAGRDRGCAVPL